MKVYNGGTNDPTPIWGLNFKENGLKEECKKRRQIYWDHFQNINYVWPHKQQKNKIIEDLNTLTLNEIIVVYRRRKTHHALAMNDTSIPKSVYENIRTGRRNVGSARKKLIDQQPWRLKILERLFLLLVFIRWQELKVTTGIK